MGQNVYLNTDSLSNRVNLATNSNKPKELEKALATIVLKAPNKFEQFKASLDQKKLRTYELKRLNSFSARKLMYENSIDQINALIPEGNPFIYYFRANTLFLNGQNTLALRNYREALTLFTYYNDSAYIASTNNNIGTLHWHSNQLDSALIYFLKSRNFSSIFNEVLENNILAISLTLDNQELSLQQIRTIRNNTKNPNNPYFLNNSLQFYKRSNPIKRDSTIRHIRKLYPNLSAVPAELLPEYIRNNWDQDSILTKMLSIPVNSFFQNSLSELLMSPQVYRREFTTEILQILANKSLDRIDSNLAIIHSILPLEKRKLLAESLQELNSAKRVETLQKLAYAANEYELSTKEQENQLRRIVIIGISLLTLGLLAIIFSQYRRIQQVKESARLAQDNAELTALNTTMKSEISRIRRGIENLTEKSINRISGLRIAIEEFGKNPSHAIEMLNDLNIIASHEEGLLRFRIKRLLEGIKSTKLDGLQSVIGDREVQIIKLTVMNFRSKEIASIMGVTPQHINNSRSKIKNQIETELNKDYDELMKEIEVELFHSQV